MQQMRRSIAAALLGLALSACGGKADKLIPGYTASQGQVFDANGDAIQLRGINMFGFDSAILIPQYLDVMGWKQQIQQVKDLGFNAVRLPFVPETLYSTQKIGVDLDTFVEPTLNADIIGKTPLEFLDLWMREADRQGLYVVLDFHSVAKGVLYPLWYSLDASDYAAAGAAPTYNGAAYSADDWVRDLVFVAQRYAYTGKLVGIDLYNEPNGLARWGTGDPNDAAAADWKIAAERAAKAVIDANPRLLVFVQGIYLNNDGIENSTLGVNYGENLQPQAYRPLDIEADKLVLYPHTYGPDALYSTPKAEFAAANFPANMPAAWETLFGQFQGSATSTTAPANYTVILGEFGGFYGEGPSGEQDVLWHDALVDYLIEKNMRSAFYWCYTPNSDGTGGILADDLSVREDKMAMLRRLFGI